MRRKKEEHRPPTYYEFLMMHELCSEEVQKEDAEILSRQPRPDILCGESVPKNLNGLSYGQLDDLRNVNPEDDVACQLARVIFEKSLDLYDEDVNKVFGFINFCTNELKRINKLFESIQPKHTSEEIAAGVENLNFGSFGVLDWYAKRMGIINQNDVRSVAWVRIFTCMKNDHMQQEFERRLQDVYMHKNTPKTH